MAKKIKIPNTVFDLIPDCSRYIFPPYYNTGKYFSVEYQKSGNLMYMHFNDESGNRIWTVQLYKELVQINNDWSNT